MRILAVSDRPSEYLWGPQVNDALAGVDLILSCGDLPPEYLEYLATFTSAPVLYVHGNHDRRHGEPEPEGCICADGRLVTVKGLRVLGLGGSIRYNPEGEYQYTQRQMRRRVWRLQPALWRSGGFDILLTHSAALGHGDGADRAHVGFEVFHDLLDRWHPPVFIHGHSHLTYSSRHRRLSDLGPTRVINAYERYAFDWDELASPPEGP